MAGDNPTLAAANESTGLEPLNAQPKSPQPPKQDTSADSIPTPLTYLPSQYKPIMFPLDLGSRTSNNQSISSLPSANQFEDLVKAKILPPGPTRAEEVSVGTISDSYADALDAVRDVVDDRQVKVYKVETGVQKGEYYIVGLHLKSERIIGVRV
ncbi:hypothetical protein ACLMJK_003735 [Lecanora helva]